MEPSSSRSPGRAHGDALLGRVRATVDAFVPTDDRSRRSKEEVLAAFDTLPAPFDEHADLVHVTGSAIVTGRRGVVLLVHRRLGFWMQPGGHLDPGEAPWDGARRETEEETGLAARHPDAGPMLVHVDVHTAARGHRHLDLRYLLLAPDEDPVPPPDESQQVQWFSWDDASEVADESLRSALVTARDRIGSLALE
jgi:8-oxo-dGTP pyrophosphatase MutT (NUDIX family)